MAGGDAVSRRWTDAEKAKVLALSEQGLKSHQIGARYGVSGGNIRALLFHVRQMEGLCGDAWQRRVRKLMRTGLGTEDIAVELGCPLKDVEAERDILRAEGRLDALYACARPHPFPFYSQGGRVYKVAGQPAARNEPAAPKHNGSTEETVMPDRGNTAFTGASSMGSGGTR